MEIREVLGFVLLAAGVAGMITALWVRNIYLRGIAEWEKFIQPLVQVRQEHRDMYDALTTIRDNYPNGSAHIAKECLERVIRR